MMHDSRLYSMRRAVMLVMMWITWLADGVMGGEVAVASCAACSVFLSGFQLFTIIFT